MASAQRELTLLANTTRTTASRFVKIAKHFILKSKHGENQLRGVQKDLTGMAYTLIVGPAGVGKTFFVHLAVGQEPPTDDSIICETNPPVSFAFQDGLDVVDTPGFDPTYPGSNPLVLIIEWMREQTPGARLSGVIYLANRASFPDLRHLMACQSILPRLLIVGSSAHEGLYPTEVQTLTFDGAWCPSPSSAIIDWHEHCDGLPSVSLEDVARELALNVLQSVQNARSGSSSNLTRMLPRWAQ